MVDDNRHNKISGKTEFSGRRRKVTRVSGYKSHPSATGGHFKRSFSDLYPNKVKLSFIFPMGEIDTNFYYGFKFFFRSKDSVFIESDSPIFNKKFVTEYNFPNWNKCSNLIRIDQSPKNISIILTSNFHPIEIYGAECGFAWDEAMLSLSKKSLDRFGEQSAECIFLNDLRGSIEFDPPNPISKNEVVYKILKT